MDQEAHMSNEWLREEENCNDSGKAAKYEII